MNFFDLFTFLSVEFFSSCNITLLRLLTIQCVHLQIDVILPHSNTAVTDFIRESRAVEHVYLTWRHSIDFEIVVVVVVGQFTFDEDTLYYDL